MGANTKRAEVTGEPGFGDRFARLMGCGPGTIRECEEGIDEGAGEEALGAGLGKDAWNIGEEAEADVLGIEAGFEGKFGESVEGALGPIAADDLCDGEKWAPVVGKTIKGTGWQRRIASGEGGEVVLGPARELTSEGLFDFGVERIKACSELAVCGGHQRNENG